LHKIWHNNKNQKLFYSNKITEFHFAKNRIAFNRLPAN